MSASTGTGAGTVEQGGDRSSDGIRRMAQVQADRPVANDHDPIDRGYLQKLAELAA